MTDSDYDWIEGLKRGDSEAARTLWDRFFNKAVRRASAAIPKARRRSHDEEDIALSAMHSLVRCLQREKYQAIADESELWAILVTITNAKLSKARRKKNAAKRPPLEGESVLVNNADPNDLQGIAQVAGTTPTPAFLAEMGEQCEWLLAQLPKDELREVAILKLEGYTNEEIAQQVERTVATIERRLRMIRQVWDSHSQNRE